MKYYGRFIVGFLIIISCNNRNNTSTSAGSTDIFGFWEGTYTVEDRPDLEPQYYNMLIKRDGNLTIEGSYLSSIRINIGTWELEGNTLKFQVSNVYGGEIPNPQVGTATFDPQGRLEGSVVNLSGTGAGNFDLVKRK